MAVADPNLELAPAKVNLFLHITGRREDGYHLLDSLVVFAGIADRLAFAPAQALSLSITGPFAASLVAEADNLVSRAARALAGETGVHPTDVRPTGERPTGALSLEKFIPVASGIGGGSADAAAALRLLRRAWRVTLDDSALDRIASRLGADVPVCLRSRPMHMRGVGEILTQAPAMPPCGLLLVNPGVPLATAEVFRARTGAYSPTVELPTGWDTAQKMAASLSGLTNDLEAPAIGLVPAIRDVLRAIAATRGCLLARMSGSGATCFGLFAGAAEAEAAASRTGRPGWWTWGGPMGDPLGG